MTKASLKVIAVVLFFITGIFCAGFAIGEVKGEMNPRPAIVETDVSTWCGEPTGNIRTTTASIEAWTSHGTFSIKDEEGYTWYLEDMGEVEPDDFFLVWFDDMGTENIYDDEVIKLWREVH